MVVDSEALRERAVHSLEELRSGNARFAAGLALGPHRDGRRRAELVGGQHPWAVVLGCSDSRVPPEILFDAGLGDLFVVRTAGHVLDRGALGSVEYAVAHLDVPLVVVLGHTRCGAVTAAARGEGGRGEAAWVVECLKPCLCPEAEDPVDAAARDNVRRACRSLVERSLTIREATAAGRTRIVGAYYDLCSGAVEFFVEE
ncbi:MAG: carbonic anhydrase [Candidatus Bipolaricaulota bacterium]